MSGMRAAAGDCRRYVLGFLVLVFVGISVTNASAQIKINEFLANNGRTNFDEEGDNEDWVELFNESDEDVNMLDWALSDDAAVPRKWIFPDITIPAGGYLLVWCSGKDRVGIADEIDGGDLATMAFRPTFVQLETPWKYLIAEPGTAGPPEGWNEIDFDDDEWDTGRTGFGYGDGDDFTDLPENTNAVFTRKEFEVPNPEHLGNLILQIDFDDGFVCYLNGTRVAAVNAPAGDPDFDVNGTAKREAGSPDRFNLTGFKDQLVEGTNVLAIVGLNNLNPGSSDMSLLPELGVVPDILHTNFSLDNDGEVILLTNPDREEIDGVAFPEQTQDHSYGHSPNGSGPWRYLLTPTPELPNETLAFTEPISTFVEVSPGPGRFSDGPVEISMSAEPAALMEIRYTTNGTDPTPSSTRYTGAFDIDERTVIRVAGFIEGERATSVVSKSYFLGGSHSGNTIELPILSVSMNPADYRWIQENTGARGRGAERAGYWEYFTSEGRLVASTGFGLRLHGGAGRGGGYSTKKAYKAYFRGSYGDTKLRYPIIPETPVDVFDKLVLRSGFNDSFRTNGRATYLRDELIRDVHRDMGALAAHGSWCHLYVNMEYRGLYNIVERMDEEFLESYFGSDDWDVIKTGNDPLVGTIDEWRNLRDFIVNNDMSDEQLYRQALEMMDVENYTSYMIVNMWAQNHDWPHNNWYAARPRTPDGRWIFLCWDAEFGIGLNPSGWGNNTFEFVFGRGGYLRDILAGLVDSPIYKAYFKSEALRHAELAMAGNSVLQRINDLRRTVEVDIDDEMRLMGRSVSQWQGNVRAMEDFARNRPGVFRSHIESSPRLSGPIDPTPILLRAEPEEIVATGSSRVRLHGQNLNADMEVFINGQRAEVTSSFGTGIIWVRVPLHEEVLGSVTVRVRNAEEDREAERDDILTVHHPVPIVTSIDPNVGESSGGQEITIEGEYFLEGVEVYFGDTPSPSVERVRNGSRELRVVTPSGEGEVEVRVVNVTPVRLESEAVSFRFEGTSFIRGDANHSGDVDVSDAVALLAFLFRGEGEPTCLAALDADRTGVAELTDAVYVLAHLFQNGEILPPPYPDCGLDPQGELVECESFARCQ